MTAWLDDVDTESGEYDDSEAAEMDDGDAEDLDAESRASARRRRAARQRQIALARRRQAQARARSRMRPMPPGRRPAPVPSRPTPQQAVAAIRNLDLETKVQEDTFRSAISAQSKRMSRSEYAAVLGAATNQFIESFDAPDNVYFKAALRFAPLLLLSPQRRGTGFEAVVKDPRVIGGAAVLAITFAGDNRDKFTRARRIDVVAPAELTAGESDVFVADVVDARGATLDTPVKWASSNPDIAAIDATTGVVTTSREKFGSVVITASADDVVRRVRLRVVPVGGWVAQVPQQQAPQQAQQGQQQGQQAQQAQQQGQQAQQAQQQGQQAPQGQQAKQ